LGQSYLKKQKHSLKPRKLFKLFIILHAHRLQQEQQQDMAQLHEMEGEADLIFKGAFASRLGWGGLTFLFSRINW